MASARNTSLSSRMTRKGQVTVPKAMRDRFGLAPGGAVDFAEEDGRLVLAAKADPQGRARLDIPHPFPGWDWDGTTEEFMEMTRGEPDA